MERDVAELVRMEAMGLVELNEEPQEVAARRGREKSGGGIGARRGGNTHRYWSEARAVQ
jgi:hypothetical protein